MKSLTSNLKQQCATQFTFNGYFQIRKDFQFTILTTGFPVTTAGEYPWNFEYSSSIQAIVCFIFHNKKLHIKKVEIHMVFQIKLHRHSVPLEVTPLRTNTVKLIDDDKRQQYKMVNKILYYKNCYNVFITNLWICSHIRCWNIYVYSN